MTLQIRQDIRDQHASLFGAKTVNGRTLVVEDLIAEMTAAIRAELPQLLAARHLFQKKVARGDARYDFLPGTDEITDADGHRATAAAIRRGLLDGFFGRETADAWRLNPTMPIPADTMTPGLEGTGPAIDLGMAMGALNSGASQWMWDWEDAGGDYKDQLYRAWQNLADILAHKWDGKPLNAPNDAVVHPEDGAVWFTDPGYGSLMNYEGNKGTLHIKEAVYRIDAGTGALDKVADDIYKPNGLCFSPDYRKLYVADTGATHYPDAPRVIKVWDVLGGKRLVNGREFASMVVNGKGGLADGIRADIDGNVWASAGWVGDGYDGVHIFAPDGVRIGQIKLPEICSNVCFGGKKRNRLFMTGSQSLYAVYVETQGAHIS